MQQLQVVVVQTMIKVEDDTITRIRRRRQRIIVCSGAAFEGTTEDDD
jgi:hypothetical protein